MKTDGLFISETNLLHFFNRTCHSTNWREMDVLVF